MGELPPQSTQIGKACRWFDREFQKPDRFPTAQHLADFLERSLNAGVTVSIEMDESDDVCAVFSSINGKGKPLEQIDLLKNILMTRAGGPVQEAYEKYWLPFEAGLSRKEAGEILRKIVLAEAGWVNASATLDELLKLPFAQKGQLEQLKSKLLQWKAGHQYVRSGMPPGDFGRPTVTVLKRVRRVVPLMQAQSHILVEALFLLFREGRLDEAHLRDALDVVENYVLRTCLLENQSTRDAYKVVPTILKRSHEEVPALMAKGLLYDNKTYQAATDEHLENSLRRMRLDTRGKKDWAKAALLRIDGRHNAEVDYTDPSLEHVMPKNLDGARQWSADVGADTPHFFGNLTILHCPYNAELGRASFAEKQDEFSKSLVWLNRYFAGLSEWGPQEIDERTRHLVREFCEVVPLR